jgi:ATPase subunit of ABC transporter with duplicated ATPase domains
MHFPFFLKNIDLIFPHKTCFESFFTCVHYGDRIAILGRNGTGKSSLINIIKDLFSPNTKVGHVPQMIDKDLQLSGGERFNSALTEALAVHPDILLLDEPTNHLDSQNRQKIFRMLLSFKGTIIVASHDEEILNFCSTLWHIEDQSIHIFNGSYNDYQKARLQKRSSLEKDIRYLDLQKKAMHSQLMHEQNRASKSRLKGKKSIDQSKWPTVVSKTKALKGEETSGKKKTLIHQKKDEIFNQLNSLKLSEIIIPTFSIKSSDIKNKIIISIQNGTIGYKNKPTILKDIYLQIGSKDRVAIQGHNGSGKTTLIKGMLSHEDLVKSGNWKLDIHPDDIGFLDQHYRTLDKNKSVLESIQDLVPCWKPSDIRRHLNDFLFRKNEEVNAKVSVLSGGELSRLCLAHIAIKTPKILILDEITNNLDIQAKQHVIDVLKNYPGTLVVISHDKLFLEEIGIETWLHVEEFCL